MGSKGSNRYPYDKSRYPYEKYEFKNWVSPVAWAPQLFATLMSKVFLRLCKIPLELTVSGSQLSQLIISACSFPTTPDQTSTCFKLLTEKILYLLPKRLKATLPTSYKIPLALLHPCLHVKRTLTV